MAMEVTDLQEVANDAQAKMYLLVCLREGSTIEVRPDEGAPSRFHQTPQGDLKREYIESGAINRVNKTTFLNHILQGSGEVRIRD
jgi:hypothetical protein